MASGLVSSEKAEKKKKSLSKKHTADEKGIYGEKQTVIKIQYLYNAIYSITLAMKNMNTIMNVNIEGSIIIIFSRYIILELVRKRTFVLECNVLLFSYGEKKKVINALTLAIFQLLLNIGQNITCTRGRK